MSDRFDIPCEFCEDKESGDVFFTENFIEETMEYCPKCGRKLPESGISVMVIVPPPNRPHERKALPRLWCI